MFFKEELLRLNSASGKNGNMFHCTNSSCRLAFQTLRVLKRRADTADRYITMHHILASTFLKHLVLELVFLLKKIRVLVLN